MRAYAANTFTCATKCVILEKLKRFYVSFRVTGQKVLSKSSSFSRILDATQNRDCLFSDVRKRVVAATLPYLQAARNQPRDLLAWCPTFPRAQRVIVLH